MSRLDLPYGVVSVLLLSILLGCRTDALPSASKIAIVSTVPSTVQIPLSIERLAILYPNSHDRNVMNAYLRLEGATFQLKELRPSLRIVERFDLPKVLEEQRFHLGGTVSDQTAIRVGQVLGVDSVLLYRVEGPSIRDRVFARFGGGLPPVVVASKVIMVESGEVVFLNAVTTPVEKATEDGSLFWNDSHFQAALEQGVAQTIADLHHAFR